MDKEEFMNQKAKDMSAKELADALKIKLSKILPKEKFPIVFENEYTDKVINVNENGNIILLYEERAISFIREGSLSLLEKAVDKSRELRGKD